MRLYFRLLILLFFALLRKRDLTGNPESKLRFMVLPSDCVVKLMSNERYLGFLDLGRIDLLIRFDLFKTVIKRNWQPHVISVHIRYMYSLQIFSLFVLQTRLIRKDRSFFWIEQRFEQKGRTVATSISKCLFISKGKIIPTDMIFRAMQEDNISPALSEKYKIVNEVDNLLRNITT